MTTHSVPDVYRDPVRSVTDRVSDLLARMTREEKVAQLGSVWPAQFCRGGAFDAAAAEASMPYGIGQVTRISGSTLLDAEGAARLANDVQSWLASQTRLGIPAILHEESLHGLTALDAVVHPQSIGLAATWRPDLVERMAEYIGRAAVTRGARLVLSPIFDITRDPRWGRMEETFGEDTFLVMAMGIAYTTGVQAQGVLACGKHLVGHGLPEGGMNRAPTHIGPRELREQFLLPFEAAVRQAHLGTVMHAYGEIDGQPCVSSHELLTTILRDEWGFDGIVVSDYDGVNELVVSHQVTSDHAVAAAMALNAGMDMELPRTTAYGEPLVRALDVGLVSEATLETSVARVLRIKFELGLFEHAAVDPPAARLDLAAERDHALELARQSLVLLRNVDTLPLADDVGRIAVIGPNADDPRNLCGDYAHELHIDTLMAQVDTIAASTPTMDGLAPVRTSDGYATVLSELRGRRRDAAITFVKGCDLVSGEDGEIEAAVAAAASAEIAIVVLGERSGLTPDATSGEARDRMDIGLPGRQEELLRAVVATGTPVVLVLVAGRPLAIPWAAQHCAAILHAWVPGERGAEAIVDVLIGAANPGGKLPVTVPSHSGQIPAYHNHRPTGGRSTWLHEYVDGSNLPLWPFGFGLSYTTFELSDLELSASRMGAGGACDVRVTLTNTGDRAGDEVVQLYVRDVEASLTRPVKELRGFARVRLDPGARKTVTFSLDAEQLAFVDVPGRWLVEPGTFRIMVGTSSDDLPLQADLRVVGEPRVIDARTHYLTEVRVR